MDALALLLGVTAIQFAPVLPRAVAWALPAVLMLAPIAWRTRWRPCLFLLLGLIHATGRAQGDLDHTLPATAQPLRIEAEVVIDSLLQWRERGVQFEARLVNAPLPAPVQRLRVDWPAPPALRAGQRWRLPLRIRAPRGLRNPHGWDAEATWARAGIGALASVDAEGSPRLLEQAPRVSLLHVRESLSRRLAGFAPGSPSAGVISGLAVGDTAAISAAQWSLFRAAGITHLMAISGTHVGMFGVVAAAVARRAWRWSRTPVRQRGERMACVLAAISGAVAYALLAGFSVPSQRTALMIAVAGVARLRGRELPARRILALALMAVLMLDPAAGMQPGFWLSFGTVAWILAIESGAAPLPAWRSGLRLQAGVSVLVLPATLYCFGQASMVAAPVNLLAVPVTGLLALPVIMLGCLLAWPFPHLAQPLIGSLAAALDACWPALMRIVDWPGAQWWAGSLPLSFALGATAAAALAGLAPALRWRGIALTGMLAALSWTPPQPAGGGFEFTLLDSGDVLLAVLLTRHSTLVYFSGSGGARAGDPATSVLIPHLRARGRARVDVLVIGRADASHAAGIEALFAAMPVDQVVGGGDTRAPCLAGQAFDRDGIAIRMLGPAQADPGGRNASCVLRVGNARASVLIAGEIDSAGEQDLLGRGRIGPATLAVVPAHGSHLASSSAFIAALRPRWALIAAAHHNRFGHPRPEVIERWRQGGAAVRQVSLEGAMTFNVPAGGPISLPPGERLARPHYWTAK